MESRSCTEENDKKWRGETCKKVLKLNKIITGFRDHPIVSKEACEAYYGISENQKMIIYNYKVLEVLNEAEKHRVKFSELAAKFQSYKEKLDNFLSHVHISSGANSQNLRARTLKCINEKKFKDCPQRLLEVERGKLKDYRCILQTEESKLDKHFEKMSLLQYKMTEFMKYTRRSTKVLQKRFKNTLRVHENNMFCLNEIDKLNFGEKEMSAIIYNFCGLTCEMDKLFEAGLKLLEQSKAKVEEMWKNKETLFNATNASLINKLKQLSNMITTLYDAIHKNHMYRTHMRNRVQVAKDVLAYSPNCKHVLDFVKHNSRGLRNLATNDHQMHRDLTCKIESHYVDNNVLHNRRSRYSS